MKNLLAIVTIFGLAFTGFCELTNETNNSVQAQQEQLFTRTYKITNETFISNLKHLAGAKEGESNSQLLFRFLNQNGVEIKAPETVFINEGRNLLLARTTETHQDKIERLVAAIQNDIQPSRIR
jgi:hypothetical protein